MSTVNSMNLVKWWIDASYNVHWDSKGHNGAMMSLSKGAAIDNSNKQNINVNSSTEGELVATHDQMSDVMHTLYFIEAQGYVVNKNLIYQDNQATIRLEVDGRLSTSNKTKHINTWLFYITCKITNNKIEVEYCST